MENRNREKMSRNTESTSAGNVNKQTSSNIGKTKQDSSAEFGKNIGRSEDLSNEPSRRSNVTGDEGMSGSSRRDFESSESGGLKGSSKRNLENDVTSENVRGESGSSRGYGSGSSEH